MKHPIQPLVHDEKGVLRFKANKIVRHLLDNGGIDLNQIAALGFPREDHEQFAQLIGYSHSGSSSLSYISDEVWEAAELMHKEGLSEAEARLKVLQEKLDIVRKAFKKCVPAVFSIHPDDLHGD